MAFASGCLVLLLAAIVCTFWYQDFRYSLPTPRPLHLVEPPQGERIALPEPLTALLDHHQTQPIFLHFFNAHCPCSRFNVEHIVELYRQHGNAARFIAVVQFSGDACALAAMRERTARQFGGMRTVLDDSGQIAGACGVYSTPQAVILSADHYLLYRGNYNVSRYCDDRSTQFARVNERLRSEMHERRHAEEALREANERYERMADNVPGLVFQLVGDVDGRFQFTFVNEASREIYGLEPEAITRRSASIFDLTHPEDFASLRESLQESAATLRPWQWEGRICPARERVKWIHGFARHSLRPDGAICWDGVVIETTDRKQAETELHNAKDDAERANLPAALPVANLLDEHMTPERSENASDTAGAAEVPREKILYIEDNAANRHVIEKLVLRRPEIQLITAIQGRLGIELARQHVPDLILLDLHLPDLHGAEVLSRLRADLKTSAIPVVVLSADATARQIQRLLFLGAQHYLTKPLDLGGVLRIIDETLKAAHPSQNGHPALSQAAA